MRCVDATSGLTECWKVCWAGESLGIDAAAVGGAAPAGRGSRGAAAPGLPFEAARNCGQHRGRSRPAAAAVDMLQPRCSRQTSAWLHTRSLHPSITESSCCAGWLPGGPKDVITRTATTLAALNAASEVLDVEGVISCAAYVGHEGVRIKACLCVLFP